MKINSAYTTFMGEQSHHGIGAPVHFLRTQGCHLRCYLQTLGTLCDTPEGLSKEGGEELTTREIISRLNDLRSASGGVNLICLSGGDPLWRKPSELHELFDALLHEGYDTVVETSGTLSMQTYRKHARVSWVLDYKLQSAGIKGADNVLMDLPYLTAADVIKFVVYDEADYADFKEKLWCVQQAYTGARVAVGVYWGGPTTTFALVNWLLRDGLLGTVTVNMQAHKALLSELDNIDPKLT